MLRTFCLIFAFAFFTSQGARAGDVTLASNAVLGQFIAFSAFLLDAFSQQPRHWWGNPSARETARRLTARRDDARAGGLVLSARRDFHWRDTQRRNAQRHVRGARHLPRQLVGACRVLRQSRAMGGAADLLCGTRRHAAAFPWFGSASRAQSPVKRSSTFSGGRPRAARAA